LPSARIWQHEEGVITLGYFPAPFAHFQALATISSSERLAFQFSNF